MDVLGGNKKAKEAITYEKWDLDLCLCLCRCPYVCLCIVV